MFFVFERTLRLGMTYLHSQFSILHFVGGFTPLFIRAHLWFHAFFVSVLNNPG